MAEVRPPQDDDVIFVPPPGSCPECRVHKHDNCAGGAWDFETDTGMECPCWVENHGRRPAATVEEEEADRAEEAHYSHTRIGGFDR